MDWTQIITTLLTTTIPAILTYLFTSRNNKISNDAKLREIEATHQLELQKLQSSHELKQQELQSTIERMKIEHTNEIEKMRVEHELKKSDNNDAMSTQLAMQFLSGSLDLENISKNIEHLSVVQDKVNRMNSKKETSQFLNKKK